MYLNVNKKLKIYPHTFNKISMDEFKEKLCSILVREIYASNSYNSFDNVFKDYIKNHNIDALIKEESVLQLIFNLSSIKRNLNSYIEFGQEFISCELESVKTVLLFDNILLNGKGLLGFHTLNNGLTFLGILIGDIWTIPVFCIIYYDDGKFKSYVPLIGNLYNGLTRTSLGNCIEKDDDFIRSQSFGLYFYNNAKFSYAWDYIKYEICNYFVIKESDIKFKQQYLNNKILLMKVKENGNDIIVSGIDINNGKEYIICNDGKEKNKK